jgi:hypothetical protein
MRVLVVAAALAGAGCWTSSAAPAAPGTAAGSGSGSGTGSAVAAGSGSAASGSGADRLGYIEPISCSDVGVILRGPSSGVGGAGPAKERAIAEACIADAWSRSVIECVGRGESDCTDALSSSQQRSYDARLERWRVRYLGADHDHDGEDEPDDSP